MMVSPWVPSVHDIESAQSEDDTELCHHERANEECASCSQVHVRSEELLVVLCNISASLRFAGSNGRGACYTDDLGLGHGKVGSHAIGPA